MAVRIVKPVRFYTAVGVLVAVVVGLVAVIATSRGGGSTRLTTATTVATTTTSTLPTSTLRPATTLATGLASRQTTSTVRRGSATTAKAATSTTAALVCGNWHSSYSYKSESTETMTISLTGNTSFGGRAVTFDMQYTPPAYGSSSYPTEEIKSNVGRPNEYFLKFEITKSMNGGALAVLARADGVPSTCQSPRFDTNCCLGPEPAPAP